MQQRVQRVVLAPQVDVDPVAAAANPTEGAAHPLVHDIEVARDLQSSLKRHCDVGPYFGWKKMSHCCGGSGVMRYARANSE